jgi:hypothetical protein
MNNGAAIIKKIRQFGGKIARQRGIRYLENFTCGFHDYILP